jgi:hypothetical protein
MRDLYKELQENPKEVAKIYIAACALIAEVKRKYDIKSLDDYTCPYMRRLAELVDYELGGEG